MVRRRSAVPGLAALLIVAAGALAQTRPAYAPPAMDRYIDPSQFDVPWPKHDHYKQPWRAFIETRSGYDFLRGVGINFNAWSNIPVATRLLAESGFTTFRIEVPFGDVAWEEDKLIPHDRDMALFRQLKELGIRPTILLNGHHGAPGPLQITGRKLAEPAAKGATSIRLTDVTGLRAGYSGLRNVTDFNAVERIFTAIDPATGVCTLSKPLPKDLPIDKPVSVSTLKYRPLHAVGSAEFEESVNGWINYIGIIIRMMREAGIDAYDLELWNEMTFGSQWLDYNTYFSNNTLGPQSDPLLPGGRYWELGRRSLDYIRLNAPRDVRVIWGFSNMTFYHTPIEKLPAGMNGQSYHPYGTGTRQLEFHEQHKDNPSTRQGPPPPVYDMRLPEGYAITWIQTECLLRLTGPQARNRRPKETPRFYHYMTEHGLNAPESDVTDPAVAERMQTKAIIRAFSMWLNKGLDVMHWFDAGGAYPMGFGLLPPNLKDLKPDVKFDDVATAPMRAIRNLTRCFAGSVPLKAYTPLSVEIAELTPPRQIWPPGPDYPPLWERECFAVLPFQATATKFIVPVYVMTYDVTRDHPGSRYRVTLKGLPTGVTKASYYDPIEDKTIAISPKIENGVLTVELPVTDYPRVLTIGE